MTNTPADITGSPVRVEVHLFAGVAAALGTERLDLEAADVAGALGQLRDLAGGDGDRIVRACSVLVNSVVCRDEGRALATGDRIDVLPPFAGG
ncbi:MoaD/ThiS family protein [Brachybacterium hainanense]|uniref:MoaD/ThiS family protein n=1 Tax=Brachybacterium hainanense TaxID=1541174 RepID=A0ABV6RE34_9MICO